MGRGILLFGIFCVSLRVIYGCQLQGVTPGITRVTVDIWDYERGDVYENQVISITGIVDIVQAGVSSGLYLSGRIEGTTFYLATTANYENYEEVETLDTFTLTAQFRCSDGSAITQVFQVNVQDTNNHSPVFLPNSEYDIAIATPLLPGYQITGCQHNIVVRDIDLTTYRIDFALTGSDLFEIEYDEASSTTAKEFVAILRTTTFIRSLPETLELTISATDVDETGNDPRTSYATVRITADSDAELPEEPVFAQPLYTATYTEDDTITLDESISLQQGYHESVEFSINEEYRSYFAIIRNTNSVSLSVTSPLSADILTRQRIYLIIRADREFTSGATATLVVQLPEEIHLRFEQSVYEGIIEDNTLELPNLILTQGYEDTIVSANVSNDYFSAEVQGNEIILSMQPLAQDIIDGNTYLNLEVVASTDRSVATTVITLEIVKNDTITPLFQSPVYIGFYNTDDGLTLEQIELIQGFDSTVIVELDGEHSDLFELVRNEHISTLAVRDTIPLEELGEQTLILTIHATKFRTVGAVASIYISLPEEIKLEFEQESYEGTIKDNTLDVPNIILTQGYENHVVSVNVSNELFTASLQGNNVIVTLTMGQLPNDVVEANAFLNLIVTATTSRSSTFTILTLEVIKNDTTTPVFESALYSGTYTLGDGLTLEQINVIQGYDESVEVTHDGEHANLFTLIRNGAASTLTVNTIPPAIFSERNIALTVTATKPRTVGSTAVINIALPTDRLLEFGEISYKGTYSYQSGNLTVSTLVLSTGYDETVNFDIDGEHKQYFEVSNDLNQVSIEMIEPLSNSVVLENNFLQLVVIASGINALPASVPLTIEIIKDDVSTPLFGQNIYSIAYSNGNVELNPINLIQGFDSTVSFRLDGDDAQYFSFNEVGEGVTLSLQGEVPEEVIFNQKNLVFSVLAEKPLTVGAHTTVVITFPAELTDTAIMRFSQNTYIGSLDNGVLNLDQIVLETGYKEGTQFLLSGEYYSYFAVSDDNEIVTITTSDLTLPQDVLERNKFIVLEVEARRDRAASVFSSVVIELIYEETTIETPVFNAAYYRGSFDLEEGLQFSDPIHLVQGYDNTVSFDLQGEFSDYFSVSDNTNDVTLSANAVPESVWENNDQLILTLVAIKPGVVNVSTAIVIDMPKDIDDILTIIRFERSYYIGSIENDNVTIEPITLTEGYTEDVVFALVGDLASYFTYTRNGATVTLTLDSTIPDESIPTNGIIVLGVQASTPTDSLPAVTTVILEVVRDNTSPDIENLVFGQTYYVGTYNATVGVTLENPISLAEGFNAEVLFTLDGESSTYFAIAQDGNSITLTIRETIPPAVIANNNQLLFVINAQSTGGANAHATVVILLPNEVDENTPILGFERSSYIGSIENDIVTIQPITLTEGYTEDVVFTLVGDLASYFTYTRNGATVTLTLDSTIPDESIPTNGIIVLGVQASTPTDSLPAVTTVILEVVRDNTSPDIENLVFGQTYYVGTYNATVGVTLENPISLAEGFNAEVLFTLDGESSTYFAIAQDGNSITLTIRETIPPAVIANNNQLLFVINAQSTGGANAQATVVILLPNEVDENTPILGFERSSYIGSIENDIVTIQPITLTEGYTEDVVFTLVGDLASYFTYTRNGATVTLTLDSTIPDESIPTNGIIVLGVQASTPTDSLPAVTTVILEVVRDNTSPDIENLVFGQTYYVGTYNATVGVTLENPISLAEGFNAEVLFTLHGESSTYFAIAQDGNSITLTIRETIPPAVIANNNQLLFVINAQSTGGANAQATVVILLPNEVDENTPILGFERSSYIGAIENDIVTIQPITLTEGYTEDVVFTLVGDLASYFTYTRNGATVTLTLDSTNPDESIPTNGIIVLGVQASTLTDSLPAVTTVILEVVRDNTSPDIENLVFGQTYYVGTYNATVGVTLENPISLAEGFNAEVLFTLDGESSTYFAIAQDGNSITLTIRETIPPAVIANNNQLLFVINAQSTGGANAQATVVILLPNEVDENTPILGFERSSYIGAIENDIVTIQPITLTEGYTEDVVFTLVGDLASYFTYTRNGATVTLTLDSTIPDESIPTNGIIVLGVQASTPTDSLPAVTTVILEVVRDNTSPDIENLVFGQTYYVGTYNATVGVTLENPISLAEGFNAEVLFTLDGESSTYFAIAQDGNSITLTIRETIPPAVIANNNQLLFVINAQSTGGANAQATVVILLPNEVDENTPILGFERSSYIGAIENDIVTIQPITLTEGYTEDVVFTLVGDLASYFTYTRNGATVTLTLDSTIPDESIPTNGIIVLGVQASTPTDSLPAVTTVILEVVRDNTSPDIENLVFGQTYYVGTYNATVGVTLENPISLAEGFNAEVLFTLDGESSTYFAIAQDGNSITLTIRETIPPAVIANNNQLLFVINAQSTGGANAQATVVILLPNEVNENTPILGFERSSYIGSIENDIVTIQPITLTEGYTEDVVFTLVGDLASYFTYTRNGATVTLTLDSTIPDESIPTNGIIVLGVQASTPTDSLPAVTTVILEVVRDNTSPDIENLVFGQTYYVGTYNATVGVTLENPISLAEGFNAEVLFTLDGESSTYFAIAQDGNSITLTIRETIPPAVIANNNQLLFVINAQSTGGAYAQATVVILLPNEVDENTPILGFERSSYIGSIENDIVTIQPITLTEGYTEDVVFTLVGDLASYFTYTRNGATITLTLDSTIPDESIPTNGIIVLGVQASTPTDSLPAVTTVILEVVRDNTSPDIENLVFGQTYYVGTYNATVGVTLENPISLAEGFNAEVLFTLDGESSTYFAIAQDGNSITLTIRETIPPAVIANNNQLLFVINAQSTSGANAQATVVILLPNEVDENTPILGFERSSYIGSIENDIVTIQPITLTEGYTEDVVFTLVGDLASYFTYTRNGATVTLTLDSTIPDESIPTNGIIVLGVQASTPTDSLPAVTTVILEVVRDNTSPDIENLVFGQTYYVGTYNATVGVTLENPISLAEGFNAEVLFTLDGESSTYFAIAQDGNSITLTIRETIPPAVIANNNQLLFVINAQSTGGVNAQATVVILLPNEVDENTPILGFERSSYIGSIENDIVTIQPITLTEGYTEDVVFTLVGDLASYFTYTRNGATITLTLDSTNPDESIPTNGIIVLGVQASTPTDSLPAVTTVILEVVRDNTSPDIENLVFGQTYYVGTYNATVGVTLENPISLAEGFNAEVLFTLDGESSTYFAIAQDGNSITLTIRETIPPGVIANNNQLLFVIDAQSTGGANAQATVVILLPNEVDENTPILGFERSSYIGSIENDIVTIQPITLTEGYTEDVVFTLVGDLASYFTYTRNGATVTLILDSTIPDESIPTNGIIVLGVQASTPTDSLPAITTVILEVVRDNTSPDIENLVFGQTYYVGTYNATVGVTLENPISLAEGFNAEVLFTLDGESSTYFAIAQDGNSITLTIRETIPPAVIANNNQLLFVINAQSTGGANAQATVVILLPNEVDENTPILGFERSSYIGSIENDIVTIQPITLTEGYTEDVVFTLVGDLASYFTYTRNGATVTLTLDSTIPDESIPTNGIIVLGVQASTPTDSLPAVTTVILEVVRDNTSPDIENLVFGQTYYVGTYNATVGVTLENPISLAEGFNSEVLFTLDGESSTYFAIAQDGNSITLTIRETIPPAVIANNNQLLFVINAQSTGGANAQATVVILLPNEVDENTPILGFERSSYIGSIENDIVTIQPITITEGYTEDVVFTLVGDLASYFTYTRNGATVTLTLDSTIPDESIPTNGIIVLGVQASTPTDSLPAVTTVILEVVRDNTSPDIENLVFGQTYYVGTYNATVGVTLENPISLAEGFNAEVLFTLDGESSTYFAIAQDGNSITLTIRETIPPAVIANNNQLLFVINAQSAGGTNAQATVVILLSNEGSAVTFSKVLYEGSVQANTVQHETISVTGTDETTVDIKSDYEELFVASLSDGVITVERTGSVTLPSDVTHVALEIHVGEAAAVLLLQVFHTDTPNPPPTVTFSSPSYEMRAEILQTGVVGRVVATADNGESLGYSVVVDNAHLATRLTVNNDGELLVSSPVDAGEYSFQVVATTRITQATGAATVYLSVDVTGVTLPPLIVLDRDEEQAHYNLVIFNGTDYPGCSYTLTNRFPVDRDWLYVDESGLHARVIDREDPAIAFMALSQVQVELEVHCNSITRNKRSVRESRLDWLGPYDYGTSNWILGETIAHDPTRSVVNLIVNDINDNAPIFVGKDDEPIAVGYPVPELEEIVLPRALVQLQATDADVGENAALAYWSAEPELAVSPSSGSVHVRDDVTLQHDQPLVVHATDRNGQGLSGAITLLVKLLDSSKIAVVTVRNAFLEDETNIIANLSQSVGHEVKVLRAVVISDETEDSDGLNLRKKRQTNGSGASLQLFVYGLIEREPVAADVLIENINSNATGVVSIADTISLEDHLEARQIHSGRDIGLLVATIVLSVLLFILIVAILIWFFLKWRKARNYQEFSDEDSLESRNESIVQPEKDIRPKPRINIDDLKRSERRLQEMIDAPYVEPVMPTTSKKEPPIESIVNISQPDPNILVPIVIKDKLKDADEDLSDNDEFGEVRLPRRKSVVTFNENVEKIIHVDDNAEGSSISSDVEIFRF